MDVPVESDNAERHSANRRNDLPVFRGVANASGVAGHMEVIGTVVFVTSQLLIEARNVIGASKLQFCLKDAAKQIMALLRSPPGENLKPILRPELTEPSEDVVLT